MVGKTDNQKSPVTPEEQKLVADWEKKDLTIQKTWYDVDDSLQSAENAFMARYKETFDKRYIDSTNAMNDAEAAHDKAANLEEATAFTPAIKAIIDKEMTALLPQLNARGYGKAIDAITTSGQRDGKVTIEKLKEALATSGYDPYVEFANADTNHNGIVTINEITSALEQNYGIKPAQAHNPAPKGQKR